MDNARTLLLLFHISSAALVLGATIGLLRNLRLTLKLGKDAFLVACEDAAKRVKLMGICSMLTLATGFGLILMMGGMKHAPLNYHMALGLMLVAMAVGALIMSPSVSKLLSIAQAEVLNRDSTARYFKKLAMGQGLLHLLWLLMLILMVIRIYK